MTEKFGLEKHTISKEDKRDMKSAFIFILV